MLDFNNRTAFLAASIFAAIIIIFHFSAKHQLKGKELEAYERPSDLKGQLAPDFELKLTTGQVFRLSDNIGGKIIVLNFFASWCGPCKAEMPELNSFFEKNEAGPFMLIGIDADESPDTVAEFIAEENLKFPVGIDSHGTVQKIFGVQAYPTTIVIGADGKVGIYERGAIMNADIVLGPYLQMNKELIGKGMFLKKEEYVALLSNATSAGAGHSIKEKKDADETKDLPPRALEIARKMPCPCGCSDKIYDCACQTAKDIRRKLKTLEIKYETDEEIIKKLNSEFCAGRK